jgi:hypothetical protein
VLPSMHEPLGSVPALIKKKGKKKEGMKKIK